PTRRDRRSGSPPETRCGSPSEGRSRRHRFDPSPTSPSALRVAGLVVDPGGGVADLGVAGDLPAARRADPRAGAHLGVLLRSGVCSAAGGSVSTVAAGVEL